MIKFKKLIWLVLLISWCFVIFSFSGSDGESSAETSRGVTALVTELLFPSLENEEMFNILNAVIRKIAHMTEYAILYFFGFGFIKQFNFNKIKIYTLPLLFSFVFAISDEFHQLFVGGRNGSLIDVGIDTFGALCMLGFIFCVLKFKEKLKAKNS